jgi:hypothetical protein
MTLAELLYLAADHVALWRPLAWLVLVPLAIFAVDLAVTVYSGDDG